MSLVIKNLANNKSELLVYGDIGEWDDVTSTGFVSQLEGLKGQDLTVRINSNGGSVFTAQAIFSALRRHEGNTVAWIDGMCASAATFIPTACIRVIMPRNAMYMIHKPLTAKLGNATDLRRAADVLDVVENTMTPAYMEKTGKTKEEISALLEAETYMTADDALGHGFIDEIEDSIKIAASIDGDFLSYGGEQVSIKKVPQALLNTVKSNDTQTKGGEKMDLNTLKAQHADVYAQAKHEGTAEIKNTVEDAVKAERQRIQDIQNVALAGQEDLVNEAITNGLSAGEFAINAMKATKAKGAEHIANRDKETAVVATVVDTPPVDDADAKAKAEEVEFLASFKENVNKGIK